MQLPFFSHSQTERKLTEFSINTQPVALKKLGNEQDNVYGLLAALIIISVWATSLTILLSLNLAHLPVWLVPLAIFWQTFLYTGLFITAHDAMHGSVCPQNPKLNTLIGTLAVFAYGLFSYKELLKKHWLHHRYPASDRDPDFHDGKHKNPIAWYFSFMRRYWSWKQLCGQVAIFYLAHYVLQVPQLNLTLFWFIPAISSSVQLFYFGTFLTHREPEGGYSQPHRAKTHSLPFFWSFIACYHFGYHQEHHEHPQVPWWQLPKVYKMQTQS
ncbi:fatty acid desaturase [Phormidium tenue FACHB-886]|nr:fatty acid desaturase [Phormidium tenue FACHB-886]